MIEVNADRAVADLPSLHPRVDEPFAHLAVFAAVGHALVKTVHAQDVRLPPGSVVTVPGRPRGRDGVQVARQTASNSELEQRPELAHAARTEPLGPDEVAAEDVLPRDLPAHVERELAVASREEPALLGKSRVDLDEVAAGDAVAVGEDQVVTGGRADGLVEDDRLAEAVVRVVDVANPHPGRSPYRVDAGLRVTRRAVVGDDDFEVGVRLTAVADEDLLEPVRLVVRAEDDRETHGVGLTCKREG